jgi:diguanylate cyclase (GGDEF)-like protein/PAS domain S-box-containing protein
MSNDRAQALVLAINQNTVPGLQNLLSPSFLPHQPIVEPLAVAGGGHLYLELAATPVGDDRVLVLGRDVTLDRNLRSALVESRQRYKDLVEISSDFAWETGFDGRFVFVSPKGALGYAADELVGRHPSDFVIHQGPSSGISAFAASIGVSDVEVWMRDSYGKDACVMTSALPLKSTDGRWNGARGICRNVTDQRQRDAALLRAHNRERLLTYVVRTIRDELDPADMLRAAAEATCRALNASGCQIYRLIDKEDTLGLSAQYGNSASEVTVLEALKHSDHFDATVEGWHVLATVTRYRHGTNGAICLWRSKDRTRWGDDERLLLDDVASQVGLANEQITNHERILTLSRTDALTGLLNRRAFFEELARRYQRLARESRPSSLIYCDLDNFKWVNDLHGHQMGDQALIAVREMLIHYTRPIDLVARLGGDEFGIWLEGADENADRGKCQAIIEGARALAHFSGSEQHPLQFSLGVAVYQPGSHETLEEMVVRADTAMYQVKREGKGSWRIAPPHQPVTTHD